MTNPPAAFDRMTALTPDGPGSFLARFDASWSGPTGMLGGYVAAHVVRAVEAIDPNRAVRSLHVSFLRPSSEGEARLSVETIREGRSLAVHDVVVRQADKPVAMTRVTTTTPAPDALTWATDPVELPPPVEQCEPIAPPPGIRHFDHGITVLDPAWRPFSGRPRAHIAGWMQPREPRAVDAAWLAMILDWFPPAAFARALPPTGALSVDYTVHLHRAVVDPSAGPWLAGVFRTDTAAGGLGLEHGVVASADGTLLAESFHTRVT